MPGPRIGDVVHYRLSTHDVDRIERTVPRLNTAAESNLNSLGAGDVCPAVVLRVNSPSSVNLRVLLDGGPGAELWATSRQHGTSDGQWSE